MLLRHHASATPSRVALRTRGNSWTWAELDALVDRAATALLAQGASRVAIVLPNDIDFVVAFLGTLRAGLMAIPVNPGFTPRELNHVLADSGADVVITSAPELASAPGPLPEVDPAQVAILLYTSGTEGAPKGAMLTHRALIANHEQIAQLQPPIMSADDVVLLALPMFHAYGLNTGLGATLWYGATGVLEAEFDPVGTAGLIALHRVTVAVGVPAMYQAWTSVPNVRSLLASLRLAVCGAAALEPAVAAQFAEVTGHAVHIGYGLTETAPVVTSTLASASIKPGSIGRAIPGIELRLTNSYGVASDDDDPQPGSEDPGEIVVRGANLFLGYWPDQRGGPDAEGWWPTGDVAYADADGDLFIVDRIGELIIINGFNVYPAEVELVIAGFPGVREVAVTGPAVTAYVVAPRVSEAELAAHCEANLARFKRPSSFVFVDELPHSAIGKVRKKMLRDDE
jgi:long-chain acyl-CoA synthetase